MPRLPADAILIADLVEAWPRLMPELRDQGEADRMNDLLCAILDDCRKQGKTVPNRIFVADAAPSPEREKLLASDAVIKAEYFAEVYARWDRSPQFRRFWASMTDEEKIAFWREVR